MAEDGVEGELGEVIELTKTRAAAGKPSQQEQEYVKKKLLPVERRNFINAFGEPQWVLGYLSKYKLDLDERAGISLPRPLLCAHFLLGEVSDQCVEVAREAMVKKEIEKFRFFFDFAQGATLVLGAILEAENESSDRAEETRQKIVAYESKVYDFSASEAAEEYLWLERTSASSLRLLRQDPSGFLLLDSLVGGVKRTNLNLDIDFYVKDYVLAGAEVARDLYKKLYKIAEPLYPKQKQK